MLGRILDWLAHLQNFENFETRKKSCWMVLDKVGLQLNMSLNKYGKIEETHKLQFVDFYVGLVYLLCN